MTFLWLYAILVGIYVALYLLCSFIILVWNPRPKEAQLPCISICIALKEEENNLQALLTSLARLDYPFELVEIVFVDDASKDQTPAMLASAHLPFSIRILTNEEGIGKKASLSRAIAKAEGDWIAVTDGDCQLKSSWLKAMVQEISPNSSMIIGPVATHRPSTALGWFDYFDLLALNASGLALNKLGKPTLSNGANYLVKKNDFQEVNGFEHGSQLASGDDMFLMLALENRSKGSVASCINPKALVTTHYNTNWWTFFHQKIRWGSKWNKLGSPWISTFAIFIFLVNFFQLVAIGMLLLTSSSIAYSLVSAKIVIDGLFLLTASRKLNVQFSLFAFLLSSLVYPVYALMFGLLSATKNSYLWKGKVQQ